MDKEKLLEKFDNYCKSLSSEDKVAVMYHCDADGFASALITARALYKIAQIDLHSTFFFHYGSDKIFSKKIAQYRDDGVNKYIIVDLNIDEYPDKIKEIESFADVLIIDHHKEYRDLNSEKTTFLKAKYFSELDSSRYPAAKFTYDLFSRHADLTKDDWIACIGILGDMGYKTWEDFFNKTIERSELTLEELFVLEELVSTTTIIAVDHLKDLFAEFYNEKNPKKLLNSIFMKNIDTLKNEINYWFGKFGENAKYYPEISLYIYEVKPKYPIKSYLADKLSRMYPDKAIILIQDDKKDVIKFSARRQDFKIKMNDYLEEVVKDIENSNAGGHIPAAAGQIPRASLEKFKENAVRVMRESKSIANSN